MVAPPLLWLGAPLFPMLRGLPRPIRTYWVAPLVRARGGCADSSRWLTHPVPAWPLFVGGHLVLARPAGLRARPALERLALSPARLLPRHRRSCSGIPSSGRIPSRPRWSPWLLIPYLILADVQNTLLSALLTFSDRPLYPYYAELPRLGNLSPLDDQAAAGVLMWVPGSLAFLVPLFVIGIRLLFGALRATPRRRPTRDGRTPRPGALAGSACPAHRRAAAPSRRARGLRSACACPCWAASCDGGMPGSRCKSRSCCWPGSSSSTASAGRRSAP